MESRPGRGKEAGGEDKLRAKTLQNDAPTGNLPTKSWYCAFFAGNSRTNRLNGSTIRCIATRYMSFQTSQSPRTKQWLKAGHQKEGSQVAVEAPRKPIQHLPVVPMIASLSFPIRTRSRNQERLQLRMKARLQALVVLHCSESLSSDRMSRS